MGIVRCFLRAKPNVRLHSYVCHVMGFTFYLQRPHWNGWVCQRRLVEVENDDGVFKNLLHIDSFMIEAMNVLHFFNLCHTRWVKTYEILKKLIKVCDTEHAQQHLKVLVQFNTSIMLTSMVNNEIFIILHFVCYQHVVDFR